MSGFSTTLVMQSTKASGVTGATTLTLPAGQAIDRIYVKNNTTNAITGGLKVGTTAGGVDILAALSVGSLAQVDASPLIGALSSAPRTIYIDAVLAWNGASIDITVTTVNAF